MSIRHSVDIVSFKMSLKYKIWTLLLKSKESSKWNSKLETAMISY